MRRRPGWDREQTTQPEMADSFFEPDTDTDADDEPQPQPADTDAEGQVTTSWVSDACNAAVREDGPRFVTHFVPDLAADLSSVLDSLYIESDSEIRKDPMVLVQEALFGDAAVSVGAAQIVDEPSHQDPEEHEMNRELTQLATVPELAKPRALSPANIRKVLSRGVDRVAAYPHHVRPEEFPKAVAAGLIPDDLWALRSLVALFKGVSVLCFTSERGAYRWFGPSPGEPNAVALVVYLVERVGGRAVFYKVGFDAGIHKVGIDADKAGPSFVFAAKHQDLIDLLAEQCCTKALPVVHAISTALARSERGEQGQWEPPTEAVPEGALVLRTDAVTHEDSDSSWPVVHFDIPGTHEDPSPELAQWEAANDTLTPFDDPTVAWPRFYLPTEQALQAHALVDHKRELFGCPEGGGPCTSVTTPPPNAVTSVEDIMAVAIAASSGADPLKERLQLRRRFWLGLTQNDFVRIRAQTLACASNLRELLGPAQPWPWVEFSSARSEPPVVASLLNRAAGDTAVAFPPIPPVTAALISLAWSLSLDVVAVDSDTGEIRTHLLDPANPKPGKGNSPDELSSVGRLVVVDYSNSQRWSRPPRSRPGAPYVCAWPLQFVTRPGHASQKAIVPTFGWLRRARQALGQTAETPELCQQALVQRFGEDFSEATVDVGQAETRAQRICAALPTSPRSPEEGAPARIRDFERFRPLLAAQNGLAGLLQGFLDACWTCSLPQAASIDAQQTGPCTRVAAEEVELWRGIATSRSRDELAAIAQTGRVGRRLADDGLVALGLGLLRKLVGREEVWVAQALLRRAEVVARYDNPSWLLDQLKLVGGSWVDAYGPLVVDAVLYVRNVWPTATEASRTAEQRRSLDSAQRLLQRLCWPRLCALGDYALRRRLAEGFLANPSKGITEDRIYRTTPGEDTTLEDLSSPVVPTVMHRYPQGSPEDRATTYNLLYRLASRDLQVYAPDSARPQIMVDFDPTRAARDLAGLLAIRFQNSPTGASLSIAEVVDCARRSGYYGITHQQAAGVVQALRIQAGFLNSAAWTDKDQGAKHAVGPAEAKGRLCSYCGEYERELLLESDCCCAECRESNGRAHGLGLSWLPGAGGHPPRLSALFGPSEGLLSALTGAGGSVLQAVTLLRTDQHAVERAALLATQDARIVLAGAEAVGKTSASGSDVELVREALRHLTVFALARRGS